MKKTRSRKSRDTVPLIPYRVVDSYHIYFFVKTNIEKHKPYVIADSLAIYNVTVPVWYVRKIICTNVFNIVHINLSVKDFYLLKGIVPPVEYFFEDLYN
jgi:hypothetical protein